MRFNGPPWLTTILVGCLLAGPVAARRNNINRCPNPCSLSDSPNGWIDYHSPGRLASCNETMLLDFSLYTPLNRTDKQFTIFACTTNATDLIEGDNKRRLAFPDNSFQQTSVGFQFGSWGADVPFPDEESIEIAIVSAQNWLARGANRYPAHIFGHLGNAVVGVYVGSKIQRSEAKSVAKQMLDRIRHDGVTTQMALQHCGTNADYTLGIAVNVEGNLHSVQQLVRTWNDGECLTGFDDEMMMPEISLSVAPTLKASGLKLSDPETSEAHQQHRRADTCDYVQVVSGDSCGSLTDKCGITAKELDKYNPNPKLCSELAVGQYICCSPGDLPDFTPKPNPNGTCYTYHVQSGDFCAKIASEHSIEVEDIESFNTETWGWMGCDNMQAAQTLCLSKGDSPFPAPIPNAVCGPQVPGTKQPEDDGPMRWDSLNPCPLNACCNVWGQCGITPEFCTMTDSPTGNPGTAKPGTDGCIDSCGTTIINDAVPPDEYASIGYFLGTNVKRECLTMDAWFIHTGEYTHIQFGFGDISSDFSISVTEAKEQFEYFKSMSGVKKVISFGGWDFSTSPSTYHIFREGVKKANRDTFAKNVVDFVVANDLDGVDFDWEYPGAPDIEGIPAGGEDEGDDYAAFLSVVRSKLPDAKSLSIAAPASFWYLQAFPIKKIIDVVDYIVFMTYDLHGQWDYGKPFVDSGCPAGDCLRSHVNSTETEYALAMITKAGASTRKLTVGVSSYGRAFEMTTPGCTGPMCTYTEAGAAPGRCTATSGYLANAEINEIIDNDPSATVWYDKESDSDYMVYDDTQWVAYMTADTKRKRMDAYKGLNLGGATEWSIDLKSYVPGYNPGPGIFVPLPNDTSMEEFCELPDPEIDNEKDASSLRNVSAYIDYFLTEARGGKTKNWDQPLFGDSQIVSCSLYPEGPCGFPAPKECNNTEPPSLFWARYVAANFFSHVVELGALFDVSSTNTSYSVSRIASDFPAQYPDAFDLTSLFGHFGAALTMGAGAASGNAAIAGATTVLSGAFSLMSGLMGDDSEVTDPTEALYAQMQVIFTAAYNAVSDTLIDMFEDGDLSSWDSELTKGKYDSDIANALDGKFMFRLKGSQAKTIQTKINTFLSKTLVGAALRGANYYILQDSHPKDKCEGVTSGKVIDGKCYTIEAAGGGWMEKTFSVPISEETLEKVTDTYGVDLTDLYKLSLACQKDTDVYAGRIKLDRFTPRETMPDCFYNLPVFYVEPSEDSTVSSSPCWAWASNYTSQDGDKPEVGSTYLPPNLADIFKYSYCQCYPPTAPLCMMKAADTNLIIGDLGNVTNATQSFVE